MKKKLLLKGVSVTIAAGLLVGALSTPMVSAAEGTIYATSTTHLDTVWSWPLEQVIEEYLPQVANENIKMIEENPEYEFNFEGAYRYELLKEYYPELFEKVKEYVQSGQWNVSGSAWENGDVNTPSPEALFRNILYGNNYFEDELGARSKDIYLPDCFGFGYALPSIIAHSNLLGFSTQKLSWGNSFPNQTLPYDIGMWTGPDGASIIANINLNAYTDSFAGGVLNSDGTINNDGVSSRLSNSRYSIASFLFGSCGDRGGAPSNVAIQKLIANQKATAGQSLQVKLTSTDQIFKDLTALGTDKLSNYNGEMLMRQHGAGTYTSRTISKRWNRQAEQLGYAAEAANVNSMYLGASTYPAKELEKIWENIIAHQFHDDITGTSNAESYLRSWNDYMIAIKQFASEYENGVSGILSGMDTSVNEGVAVVVNNSLAAERTNIVKATVTMPEVTPYVRVFDDQGEEVASQVLSSSGKNYSIQFKATVPSLGYRKYKVVGSSAPSAVTGALSVTENRLENEKYIVTLDTNGDISQIYDKEVGKNLLSSPIRLDILQNNSNGWPAWELNIDDYAFKTGSYVTGTPTFRIVENGPARVAVEVTRTNGKSAYKQTIGLSAGGKLVDVSNVVDWYESASLLKAEFNLTSSNSTATYDLGLGVIQRGNDASNLSEVPVQKWADLTAANGSYGVSIINDCKYGMDKLDNDTLRLTLIHTPKDNYTNGWYGPAGQNTQDFGENRFSYAIYGHNGNYAGSDVQLLGEEYNQPMKAFQTDSHTGELGSSYSFGSISNQKVLVRALKKAEKSDEIIVRVNEGSGAAQKDVRFSLGDGIASAREVYASEESLGTARVENGSLVFDIGSYGVKTFALTLQSPAKALSEVQSKPLDLPYNADAYSGNSNKDDGGLTLVKDTYPSELVPDTILSGGVTYQTGDKTDGKLNAVKAAGQTISLPAGYNTLKILAASTDGDKNAVFKVGGNDVSLNIGDFSENIADWDLYSLGVTGYVKDQNPAFVATHRHTAGKDNVAKTSYMFDYSIDVTGAGSITLPNDSSIIIFAGTLLADAGVKSACVTQLHDEKARTPGNGSLSNTTLTFDNGDTGNIPVANIPINEAKNVSNYSCTLSNEQQSSGDTSLKISGTDDSESQSFVYFTLSTAPIKIEADTVLSYKFYAGNENGRFSNMDMEFNSGQPLRDRSNAVDGSGIRMHPETGRGTVGQWITVTCDLGKYAAGQTMTKLMFAYDKGPNTGNFTAYIDDLYIGNPNDTLQYYLEQAEAVNQETYSAASYSELDYAYQMAAAVADAASATDYEKTYAKDLLKNAYASLAPAVNGLNPIPAYSHNQVIGQAMTDTDGSGNPANVGGLKNCTALVYKGLDFGPTGVSQMKIRYSGWNTGDDSRVVVYKGSGTKGKVLAVISIPQTGEWSNYTEVTGTLSEVLTGEQDITLMFRNSSDNVANVQTLTFIPDISDLADYTAVDEALGSVPAVLSPYTEKSRQELQAAIEAVDRTKTSDQQEEVDQMAENILAKLENLLLIGDVNEDKQVGALDIMIMRKVMLNGNPTDRQLEAGDLDGNNEFGAVDIMKLRKLLLEQD